MFGKIVSSSTYRDLQTVTPEQDTQTAIASTGERGRFMYGLIFKGDITKDDFSQHLITFISRESGFYPLPTYSRYMRLTKGRDVVIAKAWTDKLASDHRVVPASTRKLIKIDPGTNVNVHEFEVK